MADFIEAYPGNEEPFVGVSTDLRLSLSINGVLEDPDSFDVAVTSLRTSALVTVGATSTASTGELIVAVPNTSLTQADVFSAVWDVTTTGSAGHQFIFDYDVRQHPLFTLAEIRGFGVQKMTAAKFPDEEVVRMRKLVADMFEDYCNVGFSAAYSEFTMDGPDGGYGSSSVTPFNLTGGSFGRFLLFPPVTRMTSVAKVEVDGTAFTAGQLADLKITEGGAIYNLNGWSYDAESIKVGVVHGHPFPPRDVRRAAMSYTQHLMTPGKITERAIILTDETGTWRLQSAKVPDRPTGFPDIDFVLAQNRETVV